MKTMGIVLLFPVLILGASAVVSWQPNAESDLGGYQVYYGTSSNFYSVTLDVGNVNQYTVNDLLPANTYYFAITAYDVNGNESDYSLEVPMRIEDTTPPAVVSSACELGDRVKIVFSEALEKASAELITNYSINYGITVNKATLQTDQKTVYLTTTQHINRWYIMTINNVRDASVNGNMIAANTQTSYLWQGGDTQPPTVSKIELLRQDFLAVTFSEALNQSSATALANYSISPAVQILSSGIDVNTLTTVYLSTAAHTAGQAYTLTINNVKDGSGNANPIAANTKINYSCTSGDANPPTLVAARLTTNTQLQVEFNEKLEPVSAQTVGNYTISPLVRITGAVLNVDKTIVVLSTDPHPAGGYTITVRNVGDANTPSNIMTTGQLGYVYTPPDATPPAISTAVLATDNLLQVTFSEMVERTSAEAITNYAIDPSVRILSAMLNVTQQTVMLQTDPHPAGTYTLRVNWVKDLAAVPNTIAPNASKTYLYAPQDITPPILQSAVLYGSNLVELVFNESLDRATAESVTGYSIDGGIKVISAVKVGDIWNRVQLTTTAHQAGQAYNVTVTGIKDKALNTMPSTVKSYTYPVTDSAPPRLISATLTGGNQFLELVFNEPITQATAETKSNYNIGSGVSVEAATLDAQGTKVFLKTATHSPGLSYTVTVLNIKDLSGNAIAGDNQKTYSAVTQDVLPPQLSRADLLDDNTLELVFSEPVNAQSAQNKSNYSISNGITITGATLSATQMQVWLSTTRHQRGVYTVTASGIKDMASTPNTLVQGQAGYFYQPPDTSAPVLLTVKAQTETMLELTFSEQLDRASALDVNHYRVSDGVVVVNAILDVTMTKVYLTTTKQLPGHYSVTVSGIKDASSVNNPLSAAVTTAYDFNNLDRTPPIITEAKAVSQRMVNLKFSEPLNRETAQNPANYRISNNVTVSAASLTFSDNEVILETSAQAAGEYTVTVNGIKDASAQQNPIMAYTQVKYTWAPLDTTGPALTDTRLNTNALLELTFDEALDPVSSKNAANYSIVPAIRVKNAVLDDSQMKVWLYTDDHTRGTYTVTVSNVKDRAFKPNLIGKRNRFQYACLPPDTTAPKLISASLNTPTSLKIVFDEEVTRESAETLANYTIDPKVEIRQAYLRATLNEVHLETAQHQSRTNYVLRVRGIKDRTAMGNAILTAVSTTYNYVAPDTTPPVLMQAKLRHPNLLELLFNKPLEQSSAENRDNYRIDPSVEVLNATLDTASLKIVQLSTTTHMPGVGYGINVKNVHDRNTIPNTIKPTTWYTYSMAGAGTMADKEPPVLARVDMISPTQIDLVFSKPLDRVSAENSGNYVILDSVTVKTAKIDTNLVKVHLTTTEHRVGKAYRISVKNLADRAAKPNILSASSPVKYLLAKGMAVSNPSRGEYGLGLFSAPKPGYADRDYQVTQAPDYLNGAVQILTSNNDKTAVDDVFLTFELRGAATVYVAFDKGIANPPGWLADWKSTGDQVTDSRSTAYQLYSKRTIGGRFSLGSNKGGMDNNMYLVFITPNMGNGMLLAKLSRSSYVAAQVGIGDPYYIDRDYTVSSMPDSAGEYLWIRTANDDKIDRDEDFLSFSTTLKSDIYVAYDSKIASLPKWLVGWEQDGGSIVDSRGAHFDLYKKTFEAGDVSLGGNCGSLDDNMYFVLLKPLEGTGHDAGFTDLPGYFTLSQNYPNPFNPKTTIRYVAHKDGHLKITVFNVLGQTVRVLVDGDFKAGAKDEVVWDATNHLGNAVSSGIYFYRIEQDQFAKTRRMLLLR